MVVNATSHLHLIREFLPEMILQKKGHIVSIASMAGLTGVPRLADYCASKFMARAIDESLRLELKKDGHYSYVKTTCICPYYIKTGMFDGANISFPFYKLEPKEVSDRIIYAIRQNEAFVCVPWRGNIAFLVRLLPTGVMDYIGQILGVNNFMDHFTGRV